MNQLKKKLKLLGYDSYRDYLESPHWLKFKKAYYAKKRFCVICTTDKQLNLHHVTYHRLGKERQSDVLPLCRPCHVNVHEYLYKKYLGVNKTMEVIKHLKAQLVKVIPEKYPVQETSFFISQTPEFEKDLIRSGLSVQFDTCLLFSSGTRNVIPNSVVFKIGQEIGQILGEYNAIPRKTKTKTLRVRYAARVVEILDSLENTYSISLKTEKLINKLFGKK